MMLFGIAGYPPGLAEIPVNRKSSGCTPGSADGKSLDVYWINYPLAGRKTYMHSKPG